MIFRSRANVVALHETMATRLRLGRGKLARLRLCAGARRIDHGGVERFSSSRQRTAEQVALFRGHGLEPCGLPRGATKRRYRRFFAFNGMHRRERREGQAERAGAGEQVDDAARIADGVLHKLQHRRFGFAARLQEAAGRGRDVDVADAHHRRRRLPFRQRR